jgi:hypothetical protein
MIKFGKNHPVAIKHEQHKTQKNASFCKETGRFFAAFFYSIYLGGRLVLTRYRPLVLCLFLSAAAMLNFDCVFSLTLFFRSRRMFVWLLFSYTIPLVLHRYIENTLFAFYAKYILLDSSLQQILLGGSNLGEISMRKHSIKKIEPVLTLSICKLLNRHSGELFGALFVLLFATLVKSPIPWLRLDALLLMVMWIYPYGPYPPPVPVTGADGITVWVSNPDVLQWVWILFPIMSCLSFGWAAGDVSLSAWIQSKLSRLPRSVLGENATKYSVSPLGAVMSFLYVCYIVLFAILANAMGLIMVSKKKYLKAANMSRSFCFSPDTNVLLATNN